MLELNGVSKVYGSRKVLDNISFSLGDHEVLGFLGPNGAGKTTTMNIITGFLSSASGTVKLNGHEIMEDPINCKKQIGYLPEQPPLYPDMTVESYLFFVFDLKKITLPRKEHIAEICSLTGISDVRSRIIRNLSKGYQQRVGLAQAMLGNPKLLILDEPTVGLDPKQILEVRELIRELGRKCAVIFSSHILQEIQSVCERIIIINNGAIIANDTPQRLSSLAGENNLLLCAGFPNGVSPDDVSPNELMQHLEKLAGVISVKHTGNPDCTTEFPAQSDSFEFLLEVAAGKDIRRELFKLLAEKNWPILSLHKNDISLEDAFLRLTAGDSSKLIALFNKGAA
ncbi:MAG: ABC transporter ATP-binding protein [Treponema sp.]|nr:ABC transporter ATP-binding protein [Treponema sp.]